MEGFCRSCLVKFDEPTDLLPYSEKNRRLFVYATGLQAKRNDMFTFQLCKECYLNMKVSCNFKKTCRNSDKKFKNYLATKDAGDNVDFCTFLKNNDDTLKFRLPMYTGNSTPANLNKDDDNDSTCTSIQNFMTDILKAEEIPDNEAQIIKEVIEEEADVLEDSLDSHWLQDDVSIDTDFRLDFSFSPFSTPKSTNDDHCFTPKKINNPMSNNQEKNIPIKLESDEQFDPVKIFKPGTPGKSIKPKNKNDDGSKCVIDVNLEKALKNDSAEKVMLDELLATPPVTSNISAPPTPLISNILFGDKIDIDTESRTKNVYVPIEISHNNTVLEDFKSKQTNDQKSGDKCVIDVNLKNALKNDFAEKVMLDKLLATPPVISNISAPPTPLISNILFGDKIDLDTESRTKNVYVPIEISHNNTVLEDFKSKQTNDQKSGDKCVIDVNLKNALKNDSADKVMLDELLATPPVIPNISAPSTPLISNILFGDKIDMDTDTQPKNVYMPMDNEDDIDILCDFFETSDANTIKEEYVDNYDDIYIIEKDINEKNDAIKPEDKSEVPEMIKEPSSPLENKYCLKKFLCKICDRKFKHLMGLKVHCNRIHKIKIESAKTKRVRQKMICDYCGKVFTSSKCIVRHIQNHMNPDQYFCDCCPLAFRTETGLKAHQATHGIVHEKNHNKRKYVCNICGSVQTSSSNHNIHKRRHVKKYTKTCTICAKGFYRTSDLDTHMRRHTGERPFECFYCPSKFARQDSLNRHIKCHTGEKPFYCTFCDDKFISAAHLKQHQTKCKTCLEKQMVILETEELSNTETVAVYYAGVTNSAEVAQNGPILILGT